MDPRIVRVPEKTTTIARESSAKLIFDKLTAFSRESVALFDVNTAEIYTYGDLVDYSVNLASNLRALCGIQKGDIGAIVSENSNKFWIAALAGLYLATPLHLMSPNYSSYELGKLLAISSPKFVFCSKQCLDKVKSLQLATTIVSFDRDDDDDVLCYGDLIERCERRCEIEVDFKIEEQVAIVCNSSGTTGLPKGVMITHETIRLNFCHSEDPDLYPWASFNCLIQVIPFFHVHGYSVALCGLYSGAKVLVMEKFQPELFLDSIQNHKVNKLFIVPALANFLAYSPLVDKFDLSSIEEIYSAAGVISDDAAATIRKKFGLQLIRQIYGLTEAGSAIFLTPVGDVKPGNCGKLTAGHQVKIIDTKSGEIVGPNRSGEICVKGAIMMGYLNDPVKTKEVIDEDGFLHSGDVGYYDEDGYFYVIDRLKDLIKYKSFQVAPVEIEEVLLEHPAIQDAAVVGKFDERCGELPVAFIVKRKEVEEREVVEYVAKHFCEEKRLHGGVRFVEEIPKSGIGKILRKQLRDML